MGNLCPVETNRDDHGDHNLVSRYKSSFWMETGLNRQENLSINAIPCKLWPGTLLKVTLLHGCFSRFFKLYKWYQIAQSVSFSVLINFRISGLKKSPFGQTSIRFEKDHHVRKTPGIWFSNVIWFSFEHKIALYFRWWTFGVLERSCNETPVLFSWTF